MENSNVEEDLVEEVELEEQAKTGKPAPRAKRYVIRIDTERITVTVSHMKGREILGLVGKAPEKYILRQKMHGGAAKKVGPDEVVDFTAPGVERFTTLATDQTDG